jgi:alpha-galactosidase
VRRDDLDYAHLRRLIRQWRRISKYYYGDYYPLTPPYADDAMDNHIWIAWQFNRPNSGDGMLQAFRRPQCPYRTPQFPLRGLQPDAEYEVANIDSRETTRSSGEELMEEGVTVDIPYKPGAAIIIYGNGNTPVERRGTRQNRPATNCCEHLEDPPATASQP